MDDNGTESISYSCILERRPRAVRLDLGEARPVWFPLHRVSLDEVAFTVSGPRALMAEKMDEACGQAARTAGGDRRMVTLPPPDWAGEKALGYDVRITGPAGKPAETRIFLPLSQISGNAAPIWLVMAKEREAIREAAPESATAPTGAWSVTWPRGTPRPVGTARTAASLRRAFSGNRPEVSA